VTTPIEVRRARPDEHAAVAELTARVYLDEGWADEAYAPVLRDVDARAQEADVLVAVDGGRVVGAVTVATRGGRYAETAGPGEAVIRMLVTEPGERGRGTGRALLQACLDAAAASGCRRVLLSTQREMVAAHRLYARLGFVRTPDADWRPVPDLLLLAYALDLAPADGATPPSRGASARP
jgi:ribosomal protein S18 acetylase RimI-like enzyme